MKILIVNGSSPLGYYISKKLTENNYEVIIYDYVNNWQFEEKELEYGNINVEFYNITDIYLLDLLIKEKPKKIIHLENTFYQHFSNSIQIVHDNILSVINLMQTAINHEMDVIFPINNYIPNLNSSLRNDIFISSLLFKEKLIKSYNKGNQVFTLIKHPRLLSLHDYKDSFMNILKRITVSPNNIIAHDIEMQNLSYLPLVSSQETITKHIFKAIEKRHRYLNYSFEYDISFSQIKGEELINLALNHLNIPEIQIQTERNVYVYRKIPTIFRNLNIKKDITRILDYWKKHYDSSR